MNFQNLTKAEPNGIQVYLADEPITSEAAADAATAGQTYMLKNGNILMDDTILNSYTYQGRWVANGGGSSGDKITDWISGKLKELTADDLDGAQKIRTYTTVELSLTKVELPDSVTKIEEKGFYETTIAEFLTGDGLQTVEDDGIYFCHIPKLDIGKSLQDASCFNGAHASAVTVSSENPYLKFQGGIVYNSELTTIMFAQFGLQSVTIPSTVTTTPYRLFEYDKQLKTASINGDIINFEQGMFYECSNLQSIELSNALQKIPMDTFYGCSSLAAITLPNSLTTIEREAFRGCSSLQSINIPNSVNFINYFAFEYCSSLSQINIPEGITVLKNGILAYCTSLTEITIPSTVTQIGSHTGWDGPFNGCTALKTITCKATTPPTFQTSNGLGRISPEHIYVPSSSVSRYKRATIWKNYSSIIEAIPQEAIYNE